MRDRTMLVRLDGQDPKEFEELTNEGDVVYSYRCTLLVIYPRPLVGNFACSSNFGTGIAFLEKLVGSNSHSIPSALLSRLELAESNPYKSQPIMQELLKLVLKLTDLPATKKIFEIMQKCEGRNAGLWSERSTRLFLSAIRKFGWNSLKIVVLGAVEKTRFEDLHHCMDMFSRVVKLKMGNEVEIDLMKSILTVLKSGINADNDEKIMFTFDQRNAVIRMMRIMFERSDMNDVREEFLALSVQLDPSALKAVI